MAGTTYYGIKEGATIEMRKARGCHEYEEGTAAAVDARKARVHVSRKQA